jgi:hypothetical protein
VITKAKAVHAAREEERRMREKEKIRPSHLTPRPPQPSSPRRSHPPFNFQTCTECDTEDPMEEDIYENCQTVGEMRARTARKWRNIARSM